MIYIYGLTDEGYYHRFNDSERNQYAYIITEEKDVYKIIVGLMRHGVYIDEDAEDALVNMAKAAHRQGKVLAIYPFLMEDGTILCRVPRGNYAVERLFPPKKQSSRKIYGVII